MTPEIPFPPPGEAWDPLPEVEWDRGAAKHLLLRAGFSASPERVEKVFSAGPHKGPALALGKPEAMPLPAELAAIEKVMRAELAKRRTLSEQERKEARQTLRQQARAAYDDYSLRWTGHATEMDASAAEKYVLFLQNVFVVAAAKVKNPVLLYQHQQLLRSAGFGSYVELAKAVSRSPAMIQYLDLQQSSRGRPNENFPRELFELFTLGEGHYTENDIKEAARAFTGYRASGDRFVFAPRRHDSGLKTVFGRRGRWTGDDVIDLAFEQPAATTFLPGELCRTYLSDDLLPDAWIETLGDAWKADDFDCGKLLLRFFRSRLFHHPAFRGTMIKSPVQFTIGLLQDLKLDPHPFPRFSQTLMSQMGQPFFNPPNVRGWVGGQRWINASTLAARRQAVIGAFTGLDENRLNADERAALEDAAARGRARFSVPTDAFDAWLDRPPSETVMHLADRFLAVSPDSATLEAMAKRIGTTRDSEQRRRRIRQVAFALLLSPYYQLC